VPKIPFLSDSAGAVGEYSGKPTLHPFEDAIGTYRRILPF
jgi:hypothetical protein